MTIQIGSNVPLLDAATVNWKAKTECCKRNRIIQTVALAALSTLALAILAATIAIPILLPASIVILAIPYASILTVGSIGFFVMRFIYKQDHYENPETAQKIINDLRNDTNVARYCHRNAWWNPLAVHKLAKYGFIKDDKTIINRFEELVRRYEDGWHHTRSRYHIYRCSRGDKLLEAGWIAFRDENIIPHLPNPSLIQAN